MSKFTLTLLDTAGIQNYIFASNRLQENIGASELVYRATSLWAFDALEKLKLSHNIKNPYSLEWDFTAECIEDGKLDTEVIQAAGGNTFILFKEKGDAVAFVKTLTLRLLKEAPGLTVLAQHLDDFDFENGNLLDARQKLEENMRQHKQERLPSTPSLGYGVTAQCASTGLAAVRIAEGKQSLGEREFNLLVPGQDEQEAERNRLISRETTFKLAARDLANERLQNWLRDAADNYLFPYDLDNIGRILGEESYLAVVHADGNKMGEHVKEVAKKVEIEFSGQPTKVINRKYISTMRDFSKQVNEISLDALQRVVGLVVQAVKNDAIPHEKKGNKPYLPFRPLVFGGDDVTFVCSGLIGLTIAAEYLEAFQEEAKKRELDLHASAGVSVVKLHYPFARAYALAEELIGSAKSLTRGDNNCSALDWHFAQSGLSGSLDDIRKREYRAEDGKSLHRRPLTLDEWSQVEDVIHKFNDEEKWARNKVFGLREPLRKGREAVEKYLQDFQLPNLPEIAGDEAQKTGWADGKCYYFDAIELLDHYVPLKNKEAKP